MKKLMVVCWVVAVLLAVVGCDSSNSEDDKNVEDTRVEQKEDVTVTLDTVEDTALPVCPDEVILTGLLPCDCYGTVATDPDTQIPGCQTQVVCCPTVQGLRCEDHEYLDLLSDQTADIAAEDSVEAAEVLAETVAVDDCPFEVDLSTHTPCMCQETLVEDVAEAMPECDKKVVCCPLGGLKCE